MTHQLLTLWGWMVLAAVLGATIIRRVRGSLTRGVKLPPGPKPLPILGNVFDMPRKDMGRELTDMVTKYGTFVL